MVESCVGDHREMLPAAGVTYRGFVDPSGGSEDTMTLAIAHKTTRPDERVIVDAVREVRPPTATTTSPTPLAALSAPPLASACLILSSGMTIAPGVVAHRQATNCFGSSGADVHTRGKGRL